MNYQVISADGHIDLPWLPPDLFTANASKEFKDRMPYVTDSAKGPIWVTNNGIQFGHQNGMGLAGKEYVPGKIRRSDRMAAEGLYEDGKKGIRRVADPDLRVKDQDRDGVQAEVLYGIAGRTMRLRDPEAAAEMMRIYNQWLADFCDAYPDRFAGLAGIPNHDVAAAVAEIERVVKRGGLRGLEVANTVDMTPLYEPGWEPLWQVVDDSGLPLHFHTSGGEKPATKGLEPLQRRQAHAVYITGFQMGMSKLLMEIIYGGVLEAHPGLRLVIAESGIGWIPYLLERMDLEWEDQYKDLTLTMKPSDYWHRQCKATYQSDKVGLRLLDVLGEDNVMWGSDYPHMDGVWPDSQEFIDNELGHLPAETRAKIVCGNAARLYGFSVNKVN
ncbi:MAG: amidohydrolase [Proteobacteria bacterium]|nr:amidohydrolase [Pseudomonadota bacterium]